MASVESLLDQERWHEERRALRALLLHHGLTERVKWGKLCYDHDDRTVAIIYGFKNDCAVGFFKGSLLDDPDRVLVRPGPHSQAMRRIHFAGLDEIRENRALVERYIAAAIAIEEQGLEVAFEEKDHLELPQELTDRFEREPELERAFHGLTPGRQRGYTLHFSGAKKSETRTARIERCRDRILAGKGLNER